MTNREKEQKLAEINEDITAISMAIKSVEQTSVEAFGYKHILVDVYCQLEEVLGMLEITRSRIDEEPTEEDVKEWEEDRRDREREYYDSRL